MRSICGIIAVEVNIPGQGQNDGPSPAGMKGRAVKEGCAMPKIFIVEDDENIRDIVIYALQSVGFAAAGFETGDAFWAALESGAALPDLLLLDIMLPGDDGLAILGRLRNSRRYQFLPVIMLTAKGSEIDKVKGLDLGADDYVAKPFGVMELISRINAVLRRFHSPPPEKKKLAYKNILLDQERRLVLAGSQPVSLTFKEYELLQYLLINVGLVLSREKIMRAVWGYDNEGESRTLDMHIRSLRQKLGEAGHHIRTIRHVGYCLGG